MNYLDWIVLFTTVLFIVLYGTWKTRKTATMEGYLKADNSMKWWMIGVSIMATQASAITFLSTTGQGMEDGMRFIQFYFGLPIAMVIISVTMVPIYYRLKVFTAYEYLETRFDAKTRALAAFLFLVGRGVSAGITLFAPSLILSTILHWPVAITTFVIGTLVIIYVTSGGTKAVSLTQRQQLAVVMTSMIVAGLIALFKLPDNVSFSDTIQIAGLLGKFNMINFLPANIESNLPAGVTSVRELSLWQKIDLISQDRYNMWFGLLASVFLFLSYFGTDQSQVGRYLGGVSITESRLGLMFNGLLKIPMQFIILFIGVLVFVFYIFFQPPVFYNQVLRDRALETPKADSVQLIEKKFSDVYAKKRVAVDQMVKAIQLDNDDLIQQQLDKVKAFQSEESMLRTDMKNLIARAIPNAKTQDRDYIFLNFVLGYLPHGIIGLLLAVIFLAAMSSMAGELNALVSTTSIDVYKRAIKKEASSAHYLKVSRWFTIGWAVMAMIFAMLASFAENLIQFVNIVGSLYYGTLLGIFLVAFYIKRIGGTAVFWAAIVSECIVVYCYRYTEIAFLLYNVVGCGAVIILSFLLQKFLPSQRPAVG
ncbi:MAG TPA: sodium:solute symporter [Chryseolinea sp.]